MFKAADRKNAIYFHYPWAEQDEVEIELPQGFALDNADKPEPFSAGAISAYKIDMGTANNGRTLILRRAFFFGGGGTIIFPGTSYSQLKAVFDRLNESDEHTITLKQAASLN